MMSRVRQERALKRQRLLLLAVAGLACAAGPATGQERTIDSANTFLELVGNRGSTVIDGYRISSWEGDGCDTRLAGRFTNEYGLGSNAQVVLDWGEIAEVQYPATTHLTVGLSGAIGWRYEDRRPSVSRQVYIAFDSRATAERVFAAFEFLRTSCDRSGGTGF